MSDLDVTDLLTDPEMVEYANVGVLRAVTTVGANGRQVVDRQPLSIIASVQPASGTQLNRLPDLERASGAIQVFTTTSLIAESPGLTADVVFWHGAAYTVETVSDYTAYGAGFVVALCTLTSLAAGAGAGRVGEDEIVGSSVIGNPLPPVPSTVDEGFIVGESSVF